MLGTPITDVSPTLPSAAAEFHVPEWILQHRMSCRRVRFVPQILVQWSSALVTWEDMEALKQQFPNAPAWDKQVSKGRALS
jgi:hypothetical protein